MIEWLIQNSQLDDLDRKLNHWRYYKERELLKLVRDSIDQKGTDCEGTLKMLLDDDFIIIDDLGSSNYTEWREGVLFSAIDLRHESMKPTIITTNLTRLDIVQQYHPRLADRLFDRSNVIIDTHNQESFRQIEKYESELRDRG